MSKNSIRHRFLTTPFLEIRYPTPFWDPFLEIRYPTPFWGPFWGRGHSVGEATGWRRGVLLGGGFGDPKRGRERIDRLSQL